jgi:hypothetical protein
MCPLTANSGQIVAYLQNISDEWKKLFDNRDDEENPEQQFTLSGFFADYTWTINNFMVFIFPSIGSFMASFFLITYHYQPYAMIVLLVILPVNGVLLFSISRNWFRNIENRKKIHPLRYWTVLKQNVLAWRLSKRLRGSWRSPREWVRRHPRR